MAEMRLGLLAGALVLLAGCQTTADSPPDAAAMSDDALVAQAGAPLFDGMGDYHHPISTSHPGAQRYFDQGMVLSFGFNHAESIRSFQAAQRLDPDCAMCFWGEALATGPNINVTSKGKAIMSPEDRKSAHAAIQHAMALKGNATAKERDYIEAQSRRYNGDPATDREPLDQAYADAMGKLADKYPDDDDAAVIYAEALMDTMPWNYWSEDGDPKPETVEVIDQLERVLQRSPEHPLALHLYIHAVEASANPGRAEPAADRLRNLVPGSGHLVHMPSHIYWRVGRYHDASEANVRAAKVDERYIAQCNAQGFYPALYYPHNIHFLWAAASMEGRSEIALDAARKVAANVRMEQIEAFPTVEFFKTIPLLALTQFARWDELLAEPMPPTKLDYSRAIWHYARGTAMANQGDTSGAESEQQQLEPLIDTVNVRLMDEGDYPASTLLTIANELLLGEIAMAEKRLEDAIGHFETAVETQDELPYMEPPFWYYPTRQSLGLALLEAGRPGDAEEVYRADLKEYPRNGWSMYGLIEALRAQDKDTEAASVGEKFEAVWSLADVELDASRL